MRVKTPFQVVMYIYLELKTKMMFPIVNQVMLKTIQTALFTCKVNFEKKRKITKILRGKSNQKDPNNMAKHISLS